MQKPLSAFGNNDFKNTTWGDYVLEHPEEDIQFDGPPKRAATYKAKTGPRMIEKPAPRMVAETIPENYLNELNLMRRENDRKDLLKDGIRYPEENYRSPRQSRRVRSPRSPRSPSRSRRARSPSRSRRARSPSRSRRARSPSRSRRARSPSRSRRERSPSVNEFGRNLTRNYRKRYNVSPLRYSVARDGRLINEFGRNADRESPRREREPRFFNERSRTYKRY